MLSLQQAGGHKESECWKKHPEQIPSWVRDKADSELARLAIDGMTAFMSVTYDALVETVKEEDNIGNTHENLDGSEESRPPPRRRLINNDKESTSRERITI